MKGKGNNAGKHILNKLWLQCVGHKIQQSDMSIQKCMIIFSSKDDCYWIGGGGQSVKDQKV